MRISDAVRYPAELPASRPLVVDASTVALWRFDEGSGGLARDSGPEGLLGLVSGCTWAPE